MPATFTVEDGSGLSDANAYAEVALVSQYAEDYLEAPSEWTALPLSIQERHIRVATRYLDAQFGNAWRGSRTSGDQALDWPRIGVYDNDGRKLDSDALPSALEQACAQFVIEALAGDLLPNLETSGRVTRKREKLGALEEETSYEAGFVEGKVYQLALGLLSELLRPTGQAIRA